MEVKLLSSPNLSEIDKEGRVIYETKNTLVIRADESDLVIPKEKRLFLFRLPSGKRVTVVGDRIIGRPEDRVKRI